MDDRTIPTQAQSTVRAAWESRSQKHGAAIEGVMNKSFPRVVNEVLHVWQLDQLLALIPPATDLRLLDIGCGYGRVSHSIVHQRPQVRAIGMDLAHHYARLFAHDRGNCSAIQSQIPQVPFPDETFDFVIAVEVLGYMVTQTLQRQALEEMLRVLKPSGQCVLINSEAAGRRVWTLGGILDIAGRLVGRGTGPENVEFAALSLDALGDQITAAGGKIVQQTGCPMLTLALPALIPVALLNSNVVKPLARACLRLDRRLGEPPSPSIYTISVIAKVSRP